MTPAPLALYGATGFTGRLVAEYIVMHYLAKSKEGGLKRVVLSGRSRARLESLKADLVKLRPQADSAIELLVADSTDAASVKKLAEGARVVLSTAGPFSLHGTAIVDACVSSGSDYVDITGEVPWMCETIGAYHGELIPKRTAIVDLDRPALMTCCLPFGADAAEKKGVRIVHTCGWDSIPTDLTSLLVARRLKEKFGLACARVEHVVLSVKGSSFSGGTIASMFEMIKAKPSKEESGPYALSAPVRIAAIPSRGLVLPTCLPQDAIEHEGRALRFEFNLRRQAFPAGPTPASRW